MTEVKKKNVITIDKALLLIQKYPSFYLVF